MKRKIRLFEIYTICIRCNLDLSEFCSIIDSNKDLVDMKAFDCELYIIANGRFQNQIREFVSQFK